MCYLQVKLEQWRYNQNRNAYVQTTSRMNRTIERIWHECNQRVIYQIKECLVYYEINSLFDPGNIFLMRIKHCLFLLF